MRRKHVALASIVAGIVFVSGVFWLVTEVWFADDNADLQRQAADAMQHFHDSKAEAAARAAKIDDLERRIADSNSAISNTNAEIARLEAEQAAAEAAVQEDQEGDD